MPALDSSPSSFRFGRRQLLLWSALAFAAGGASAQSAPIRSIDVTYDGTTYVLKAVMFAPAPPETAIAVLTDFPNMAKWVPNVTDSHVVKPGDKDMTIEQSGTAKLGSMSFPYTSVREIVMVSPNVIRSTQVKGSMKSQQSTMTVTPEGEGAKMQYELDVVPSFITSAVMSQDLLKKNVEEEFTAIIGEMNKRGKK